MRALGKLCEACGEQAEQVHHLKPLGMGGRDVPENCCVLCRACHGRAHELFGPGDAYGGPVDRTDFLAFLRR